MKARQAADRGREPADALAQQRATSDILRLISRSHASAQPVFETIAAAALRLCGAGSTFALELPLRYAAA